MKDNKKDTKEIVGKTFDDMSVSEMAKVQGAGDTEGETTGVCVIVASAGLSIQVTKTFKGKC